MTYESDFYGWTQEQAGLIRSGRFSDLDIANILEEIESMGRSEKRALDSRLTVLLAHLLKWHYQPGRRGKSWQLTIEVQRISFVDVLDDNPSLKPQLPAILSHAYAKARIEAAKETGLDKTTFPVDCPWDWSAILDDGFYPD
ncbi:DUF29 domain-containing protein [Methylomonas koyamae]|uniref:DUF29 domain-containing protein n=1 Tax=Methylomonas koyamae TaxID=702114 RepID=UPI00112BC23C|nr:DUF29 domain-containing protein [Methylomonas koyamae]TPQ24987.1 DUF29 domain-containing protein [Methylomonas koyamae]